MAEYTATKIMHNGDEITLGGGGGGDGGYICTAYCGAGAGTIPWAQGADFAIIGTYCCGTSGGGCVGNSVVLDKSYSGRITGGWVCACHDGASICYCGCGCKYASFFKKSGDGGKIGYIDILLVGGGASGGGYYPSGSSWNNYPYQGLPGGGGGGICEVYHMPLYSQKPIGVYVGKGGPQTACNSGTNGGCTIFGDMCAGGGTYQGYSGYPSSYANGCNVYCYGGQGAGGGAGGCGDGCTPTCIGEICGGKLMSGGNGGPGHCSCISGELHYYGGGGGGGSGAVTCDCVSTENKMYFSESEGAQLNGEGGGNGALAHNCLRATTGCCMHIGCDATYYGGGGGGGCYDGRKKTAGDGCQGIVIIRYPTDGSYKIKNDTLGGDITTCTIDGVERRIHTFTCAGQTCCFYPVFK